MPLKIYSFSFKKSCHVSKCMRWFHFKSMGNNFSRSLFLSRKWRKPKDAFPCCTQCDPCQCWYQTISQMGISKSWNSRSFSSRKFWLHQRQSVWSSHKTSNLSIFRDRSEPRDGCANFNETLCAIFKHVVQGIMI